MKNSLIYKYFNFRAKQTLRLLNYNLDYSVCFILVSIALYFIKSPAYVYLLVYFASFSFLNKRKDKVFVNKLFSNKSYAIQIIENLFVFSYISLLLFSKITDYRIFIFGIFWAILSPKLTFKSGNINLKFIDSLPSHIFEWKSTLRKNIFGLIFFYILLLFSTYHPLTLIIMMLLLSTAIEEVYKYSESKEIYIAYFQKFTLVEKYKSSLLYFNRFLIPVFILYGILNYTRSEYLLLFFISNLYFLEIISRKYKNYSGIERETKSNPILTLILLVKAILIVPSIYSIYINTQTANQKINSYVRN